MGKWRMGETLTPKTGAAFQVRVLRSASLGGTGDHVTTTVADARLALEWTIGKLTAPDTLDDHTRQCMKATFNTPRSGPSRAVFDTIKAKLVLVQNGLAGGDLSIKVEALTHQYGSVRLYAGATMREGKRPGVFREPVTGKWLPCSRGAIKLDEETLALRDKTKTEFYRPVVVLIHEASHRFADTADLFYARGAMGSLEWEACEVPAPASVPSSLAHNADSYGWFAAKCFYEATG